MTPEFFSRVPQMRDYLGEANVYFPYLMHFQRPHVRRPSFTTDEYGFRQTMLGQEVLSLERFNRLSPSDRPCALLGNSTAFGVGATQDARTISSQLNRLGNGIWFNFSGRTLNPLQEVLAFLMFSTSPIDTAVILSGINLFDMHYRFAADAHELVPPFYSERLFFREVKRGMMGALRSVAARLVSQMRGVVSMRSAGFDESTLLVELRRSLDLSVAVRDSRAVERALTHFEHVLNMMRALQPHKIGRLVFALQPVPEWFGRPLSVIERDLSILVDRHRGNKWQLVHRYLLEHAASFRKALEAICVRAGVDFLDLNAHPSLINLDWVFIDRYHLTDEAQAIIAGALHSAVLCGDVRRTVGGIHDYGLFQKGTKS